MSTRANISLQYQTEGQAFRPPAIEVMLYRHYDGYPDELGADIAEKVMGQLRDHLKRMDGRPEGFYAGPTVDFTNLVRDFLTDSEEHMGDQRNTYEITTGAHGDIEHFYEVIVGKGERLTLTHSARVRYEPGDEWLTERRTTYTLNTFIDMVNDERKGSNARMRKLKADNPDNKHYENMGLYEILPHWTIDPNGRKATDPDEGAEPLDAEQREALRLKIEAEETSPNKVRYLEGGGP